MGFIGCRLGAACDEGLVGVLIEVCDWSVCLTWCCLGAASGEGESCMFLSARNLSSEAMQPSASDVFVTACVFLAYAGMGGGLLVGLTTAWRETGAWLERGVPMA